MWNIYDNNYIIIQSFLTRKEALDYIENNHKLYSIDYREVNGAITKMQDDYIVDNTIREAIIKLVEEILKMHSQIIEYSENYSDELFSRILFLAQWMDFYSRVDFEEAKCLWYLNEIKSIIELCKNGWAIMYNDELIFISERAEAMKTAIKLCYRGV